MTVTSNTNEVGSASLPFNEYSAIYDLIYNDKDYGAEADFVSELIGNFLPGAKGGSVRVLDLACGTGRHAMELSKKGYTVEASDISSGMVKVARLNTARNLLDIQYHEQSFQTANWIPGKFDAVIAMFASLGYLTNFEELVKSLDNIKQKMSARGIFIFDVWNGLAVLDQFSPLKELTKSDETRSVRRVSRTKIDAIKQKATVHFDFTVEYPSKEVTNFSENHAVRFYFPQEMNDLLKALGFEVLVRCPFLHPKLALQANDWNMTYVVKKQA
jgi:SAM-dependent methyltransferase